MNKLNAMEVFVRVAEAGSFTAVADQLQVARSVVTRQIAGLEQHLRTKLITRSTRSLTLTAAGGIYLEKCRAILHLVDDAEASLDDEKKVPRGPIRLALPLTFGLQCLLPALLDFVQAHPHIELSMDFSDKRTNLIEEAIDLSIRITSSVQDSDILRSLGRCRLLTLATPAYLAEHGQPRHPDELRQHECLVYSMSANAANWPYKIGDQVVQFPVRGRLTSNNGHALMQAALRGLGLCIQPDFLAAPYLQDQQVVPILQEFEAPALGIYAVLPSNRYIPHRVDVLIDFLAKTLKGA
jgi:DNA-binding transcriptional LysR family regulator